MVILKLLIVSSYRVNGVNYFAFGLIILDGHYPDVSILPIRTEMHICTRTMQLTGYFTFFHCSVCICNFLVHLWRLQM